MTTEPWERKTSSVETENGREEENPSKMKLELLAERGSIED